MVNLMKQWLTTHEGWLLVLDNAADLRQLRPFLPTASGYILMTTRAQALGDLAQRLEVNQMTADEGALFLLRRAGVIADDADLSAALETDHWQQVKGPSQLSRNRQRKNEDFLVGHREKERQSA